jgi:hypothetical protein
MAPKPEPARLAYVFAMVLAVTAIILSQGHEAGRLAGRDAD